MTGVKRGHCCGKLLFARTVRLAAALADGLAVVGGRGLARGALASWSALPNARIIAIAAAIAATPAVATIAAAIAATPAVAATTSAATSATPAAAATTRTATTSTATPSAAAASTAAASTVAASAATATTTTSATTASFGRSGAFVDGEERQAEWDSGKAQHQERNAQRADHSFAAGPHGFLIMGNGDGDKSGKGSTSVTAKCCRMRSQSPASHYFVLRYLIA
jgi:hypothetical protein